MTLIKSISGIRGTIGGAAGDTLNPLDIVKFTSAYATFIRRSGKSNSNTIVVGRDARISGEMVKNVVCGTLMGMGYDVINIGLATTPTTELAVRMTQAAGGIIITASHNPRHWNALKLLNHEGEFLTKENGNEVLDIAEKEAFDYADVDHLGHYRDDNTFDKRHIDAVLGLSLVDLEAIKKRHFKVCVDAVNSVGYDLGIVVDPDVDRLAFIQEDGKMYGEEYTLVSVADYVLDHTKGATVSNLSSTRALRDVTEKHVCKYYASAVGEVNVTTKMKEVGAVIGGEGNGGVIYPESHYGRDALVGIALFLSSLAQKGCTASQLRASYPAYSIAKNRIDLKPTTNIDAILEKVKEKYGSEPDVTVTDIDGVKLDFPDKWVHLRKSNTEPIIRVYSEAATMGEADALGKSLMDIVYNMI